jgi:cytochrome c oxidase cbb3-type subunit 1
VKFHNPKFLAVTAWLTYGRIHPAWLNSLLYGFCVQAGLGVALWMLARLGGAPLRQGWLATAGAVAWNLGVTLGVLGILSGDSTGFETFELPGYVAAMLFLGYLGIGLAGLLNFHRRRERALFVSQWFVFTALFWFAWIYSTAGLLLLRYHVRGVAQAVIAWWYAGNLLTVWLGLMGLAALFYFIPKLTGRNLYSQYLALFTYWMLLLAGSWCGIPGGAPVPAWMPTVSTVARVLMAVPLLAVAVSLCRTLGGKWSSLSAHPALRFFGFGGVAFIVAGLMQIFSVLLDFNHLLRFTWFSPATTELYLYGFFAMTMFGAVYCIAPQLTGVAFRSPGRVRWSFYFAAGGVLLIVLPLGAGGVVEAFQMQDPNVTFLDVSKGSLLFLRISTLGDLLFAAGSLLFLANLVGLVKQFLGARTAAAYADVTADLFKTAGAKP